LPQIGQRFFGGCGMIRTDFSLISLTVVRV
jgi:hypothetical protein